MNRTEQMTEYHLSFYYLTLKANSVRRKSVSTEGEQIERMVDQELNILEVFILNKTWIPWNRIGPADGYLEIELNRPGLTWIEEYDERK